MSIRVDVLPRICCTTTTSNTIRSSTIVSQYYVTLRYLSTLGLVLVFMRSGWLCFASSFLRQASAAVKPALLLPILEEKSLARVMAMVTALATRKDED